eukprot:6120591-Amphidinium_carterae.2
MGVGVVSMSGREWHSCVVLGLSAMDLGSEGYCCWMTPQLMCSHMGDWLLGICCMAPLQSCGGAHHRGEW